MIDSTKLIFGKPDLVDGVGLIFPVMLEDYDEFQASSSVLYYAKAHFGNEYNDIPLLDLIVLGLQDFDIIKNLEIMFRIITRKNVNFFMDDRSNVYGFNIDEGLTITNTNYEQVRQVAMKQNLMFEQKVYKDALAREWAEKVKKTKSKGGIKMELQDMITTIAAFSGKHYWDIQKYTIYQLQSEFKRINKLKDYDSGVAFACVTGDSSKIGHYAEYLDLFRNPDDELFVSKDKLSNLNKAFS